MASSFRLSESPALAGHLLRASTKGISASCRLLTVQKQWDPRNPQRTAAESPEGEAPARLQSCPNIPNRLPIFGMRQPPARLNGRRPNAPRPLDLLGLQIRV